jgi:hypothetical protein
VQAGAENQATAQQAGDGNKVAIVQKGFGNHAWIATR